MSDRDEKIHYSSGGDVTLYAACGKGQAAAESTSLHVKRHSVASNIMSGVKNDVDVCLLNRNAVNDVTLLKQTKKKSPRT